jgi:hypothetical protein
MANEQLILLLYMTRLDVCINLKYQLTEDCINGRKHQRLHYNYDRSRYSGIGMVVNLNDTIDRNLGQFIHGNLSAFSLILS